MLVEVCQHLHQLVRDVLLDDVVAVLALHQVAVVLEDGGERVGVVLGDGEVVVAVLDKALVRKQVRVVALHGALEIARELGMSEHGLDDVGVHFGGGKDDCVIVVEHARFAFLPLGEGGVINGVQGRDHFRETLAMMIRERHNLRRSIRRLRFSWCFDLHGSIHLGVTQRGKEHSLILHKVRHDAVDIFSRRTGRLLLLLDTVILWNKVELPPTS